MVLLAVAAALLIVVNGTLLEVAAVATDCRRCFSATRSLSACGFDDRGDTAAIAAARSGSSSSSAEEDDSERPRIALFVNRNHFVKKNVPVQLELVAGGHVGVEL